MDYDVPDRLLAALESHKVKYAIFGAVALSLHGLVRNTEDLDLFLAPERSNIEQLKAALREVLDEPEIENITAEDLLGDYPAVRYTPPTGSFYIDILTRLGEAFAFADLETERVPYESLTVTVVTPRMLYKMKKDTMRGKDRIDADALQRIQFGARVMPVQKFRSIADMPDPPRRLPGDPALYKAIAGVWKFGRRANPRRFPPGVYKYRSIEDMSRAQEQWLIEHVAELARQRHGG